jgi:two-component system sensor histidine kinase YesM
MIKKHEVPNIRYKIFIHFFMLIIAIIIILDLFFIFNYAEVTKKNAHIYSYEISKQVGRNIESYVNHMKKISWVLAQDEYIQNVLRRDENVPMVLKNNWLERIKQNADMANDIESIIIFGENGVTLLDSDRYTIKDYVDIKQMSWYDKAVKNPGKFVLTSSHVQNYIVGNGKWVFSLSSAIFDKETNELLGVMLIDMSYKNLSDICTEITLGNRGYVYIISKNKDIIYHPSQQLIYSGLIEEEVLSFDQQVEGSTSLNNKLVTMHNLENIGWSVVAVSYLDELLTSKTDIMLTIVVMSILCSILAFFISQRIAIQISKPILELENIMLEVEKGALDVQIPINSDTIELQSLSRTFSKMLLEIRGLLNKIKENEKMLRKSELMILQAQINPHFLYNALDTIIWMAERKEHEKVVNMTAALARYFRISLSKGAEVISIFSEIEHVKYYLLIQKIRYENKLTYSMDIDPEVYDYKIVKIILQPLVENALYHGIKDSETGGHIKISATKEGEDIYFIVEDNGKGMTKEQIDQILINPATLSLKDGGVAVKNVHERLQVYYGKDYGLCYESKLGEWTKVYVKIPALKE